MWKIIGSFLGFLIFGPIGALIGIIIGTIFDNDLKFFKSFNIFNELDEDTLEMFSLLAADLTLLEDVTKEKVLQFKNITISFWGIANTKIIMKYYKNYIKYGYTDTMLNKCLDFLFYNYEYTTRKNIITYLLFFINAKGYITDKEINRLNEFCRRLNIDSGFYKYNNYSNNYNDKTNFANEFKSTNFYYHILGISEKATNEEIKKRYRELCKEYHPDKINYLPEKEKKKYEEKLKEIIDAYTKIKKIRNMN